jgi:hypothetical protein
VAFENSDIGVGTRGLRQGSLYFASGYVSGMDYASSGVSTLLAQIEFVLVPFVAEFASCGEFRSQFDQSLYGQWTVLDNFLDDVSFAQSRADACRVLDVRLEGIGMVLDARHATLSQARVGFLQGSFSDDRHAISRLGHFQRV